jgi:hypothetical protein
MPHEREAKGESPMKHGKKRDGAKDETKNWRERPIGADDIHHAQVLEHVYVPQEAAWQMWADDFLSVPTSAVRAPLTQLFVPADDPWPTLPYAGAARAPGLSTAQNEAYALAHERHIRASGVTLGLARLLIGMLGIPSRCERPCCSRAAACTGERRGREWCFYPGPAWPPCVHSAGRADILRPTVERLIDRLDALIEARLTAKLGEPWAAVEHVGLTHLPEEEVHAALMAMFEDRKMRMASAAAEEGA